MLIAVVPAGCGLGERAANDVVVTGAEEYPVVLSVTRAVDGPVHWTEVLEQTRAAGGDRRSLATPGIDVAEFPAFSPDGRQVAFTGWRQDGDDTAVYVVATAGGAMRRLTPVGTEAYGPAWSPDSEAILFTARVGGRETLFTVSPRGGQMRRVTDSSRRLRFPAWSPDGRHIVCESYDNHGDSELVVMRADGARVRQITKGVSRAYHHTSATYPDWSPDGRWIVFSAPSGADFNGPRYLFLIHPDGSGQKQLTVGPEVDDTKPRWSPDGRLILFWRSWEEWKLMVLDARAAISADGEVKATRAAEVVAEGVAPTGEHWDSEPSGADIGQSDRR